MILILNYYGYFLASWKNKNEAISENQFILKHRTFYIKNNTEDIWKTPSNLYIEDFIVADINSDDIDEIILLLWKRGSFGLDKPFWIEEDEKSYSQHIFIYTFYNNKIEAIWHSSKLPFEIKSMSLNNNNELEILDKSNNISFWTYKKWGLERNDTPLIEY